MTRTGLLAEERARYAKPRNLSTLNGGNDI